MGLELFFLFFFPTAALKDGPETFFQTQGQQGTESEDGGHSRLLLGSGKAEQMQRRRAVMGGCRVPAATPLSFWGSH